MAWLRKLPRCARVLLVLAGVIAVAALGFYSSYVTSGTATVRGPLDSRLDSDPDSRRGVFGDYYRWRGQRLFLQSVDERRSSICEIRGDRGISGIPGIPQDYVTGSVLVPPNTTKGIFNAPDFVEVAPQPSLWGATITCSRTVRVAAGDPSVYRARIVNSQLFRVGVPALVAILVLAAVGVPVLGRRGRGS